MHSSVDGLIKWLHHLLVNWSFGFIADLELKVNGVGSNLGNLAICRLGEAHLELCWAQFHAIQPTYFLLDCGMRNPATGSTKLSERR
jgi:hypothetical protein